MNSIVKQLLWVLLIGACCVMLWQVVGKNVGATKETTVPYSDVITKALTGQVKNVTIDGTTATGQ